LGTFHKTPLPCAARLRTSSTVFDKLLPFFKFEPTADDRSRMLETTKFHSKKNNRRPTAGIVEEGARSLGALLGGAGLPAYVPDSEKKTSEASQETKETAARYLQARTEALRKHHL
jgi:hypothetical protein